MTNIPSIHFEQLEESEENWRCWNYSIYLVFNTKTGHINATKMCIDIGRANPDTCLHEYILPSIKAIEDNYESKDAAYHYRDITNDMFVSIPVARHIVSTHPYLFSAYTRVNHEHVTHAIEAIASFGTYKFSDPYPYALLYNKTKFLLTGIPMKRYIDIDQNYSIMGWIKNVDNYDDIDKKLTKYYRNNTNIVFTGLRSSQCNIDVRLLICDMMEMFNFVPVESPIVN